MQLTKSEIRAALIAEREQLIKLVTSLSQAQLEQPSLCAGWSNQHVLGHILGFELSRLDAALLIFRIRELDDINDRQAQRYLGLAGADYAKLLRRGLRRTLWHAQLVPGFAFNKKFIPVPNGRLSLGQLLGDVVMDRAIHYLDIAAPLGIATTVTEPAAMQVAVKFVLSCIDLLNPKIPRKYYGQIIKLQLTGLGGGIYYWKIGTASVSDKLGATEKIIVTAAGSTDNFLFTVSVRPTLLTKPVRTTGDAELATIIRNSFNANALWEQ